MLGGQGQSYGHYYVARLSGNSTHCGNWIGAMNRLLLFSNITVPSVLVELHDLSQLLISRHFAAAVMGADALSSPSTIF